MSEHNCKLCKFKSTTKAKLAIHKKTTKHLSNVNTMVNTMDADLPAVNAELRTRNIALQAQVDILMKCLQIKPPVEEPTDLINFDSIYIPFIESLGECTKATFESDEFKEEMAELRTHHDQAGEITDDNCIEMFVRESNIPHIEMITTYGDNHAFGQFVIDHVLSKCSYKISDAYKGRIRLYNGDWLTVEDSIDKIGEIFFNMKMYLTKYLKGLSYYRLYDSKTRELIEIGDHPTVRKLLSKLRFFNKEDEINWMLRELQ